MLEVCNPARRRWSGWKVPLFHRAGMIKVVLASSLVADANCYYRSRLMPRSARLLAREVPAEVIIVISASVPASNLPFCSHPVQFGHGCKFDWCATVDKG